MLKVGAAALDITPPVGTALDGYGGRTDTSRGVHDPLFARALFLDDGRAPVALVVCDLLCVGSALAARARELITADSGIPSNRVMVAATHTHAGPIGMRGTREPELAEVTAQKIAGAVRAARLTSSAAALKYGHTTLDSIAQNRRHPDWPIDHRLDVLAADTPEGKNIATVARYSCHPTTMEGDNLHISADYPGEACRAVESLIGEGTTALYFNGCCGNINPTWIRQKFDDVRRLGSIVGGRAGALSQELRPLGLNHQAHNIRWSELTTKPVTAGRLVHEAPLLAANRTVDMPYRSGPSDDEMAARIKTLQSEVTAATNEDARRDVAAKLSRANGERLALARTRDQSGTRTEEIQAMRLGDGVYLLALPGEVFVETQEEIRAASEIDDLLVVSYANGYPGYFCRPEAYEEGGYEAGVTPFAPEADRILVKTALEVLQEVR